MRITQQGIAKIAGVSQATVSRVLSGDDRVELDIRDRVLGVVASHNYRPDMRARSLRQQRTGLVGLVLRREPQELEGDPFFSMLISGIIGYLVDTPFHLCVDVANDDSETAVYDEMLRSRRVDGIILVESSPDDERIARLRVDEFPFVVIGNPLIEDSFSVDNDNRLAGKLATKHLIEQGYQRIAFLSGPRDLTVCGDRAQGYCDAMAEAGRPTKVVYSDFGIESARCEAHHLLNPSDRPDALVVMDDFMAMGAVQAARGHGLAVGPDLGIVSFNDSHLCDVLENGLTSISLGIPEMVKICCETLIEAIEGRDTPTARRRIVPCELHVRGSSQKLKQFAL
ncbi:MAG: LacI family DNA-binding transcriptional regulator [Chthonomonas sp.]|nr:LacI family DNA-binding transcriptional regulator [Chthonomonas sp.]